VPGLRAMAASDNKSILNDDAGFAWPIQLISTDGVVADLKGFSTDIAQIIDPDTGTAVSGRLCSVVVHSDDVLEVFETFPVSIADSSSKPWLAKFADINGKMYSFKVRNSMPDRAIGCIVLILEMYDENGDC
jgi:hypothetical protein